MIFRALIALLLLSTLALGAVGTSIQQGPVMRIRVEGRGNIDVRLHTKEAPRATGQIMRLAKSGFYNGLRFHRVVRSPRPFLVQVGDPASRDGVDDPRIGAGGSGTKVPYEDSGFKHVAGAVGLSTKEGDRNSGDSQFHIMLSDQGFLDGQYTVFGQVISGMDVVQRIEKGDRIVSITIL